MSAIRIFFKQCFCREGPLTLERGELLWMIIQDWWLRFFGNLWLPKTPTWNSKLSVVLKFFCESWEEKYKPWAWIKLLVAVVTCFANQFCLIFVFSPVHLPWSKGRSISGRRYPALCWLIICCIGAQVWEWLLTPIAVIFVFFLR